MRRTPRPAHGNAEQMFAQAASDEVRQQSDVGNLHRRVGFAMKSKYPAGA